MSAILPERVASIAETKVGLKESPSGSNRGPEIQEFFDADSYDPNGPAPGDSGYAWCAAFVCRIVQLAMEGREWTFKRPTTPGAWAFETWSLAQDRSTGTKKRPGRDIARGDIVVLKVSHIGIATGPPEPRGNRRHAQAPSSLGNPEPDPVPGVTDFRGCGTREVPPPQVVGFHGGQGGIRTRKSGFSGSASFQNP